MLRPLAAALLLIAAVAAISTGSCSSDAADGAPQDWGEFLVWAEDQLQKPPPTVPLPNDPVLPEARWNLTRLVDRFATAMVECDWEPSSESTALLEIGPYRSDAPETRGLTVERTSGASSTGGKSLVMRIDGFRVRRNRVGSIELEMRVPYGRSVIMKWGRVAEIPIPIPTHDEPFRVRLSTDGFPDWEGPLNSLVFRTEGFGSETVAIESVRFVPRTRSWNEPAGVGRVKLGRELRTAMYLHAPGQVTIDGIHLPADARFRVDTGQLPADSDAAPVEFVLVVAHGGTKHEIALQSTSSSAAWTANSADLARWAGERVSLILEARGGSDVSIAFFANPVVYEPVAEPPLVVLYLVDTLSSQHLELYGYSRPTSARLSNLAERGAWFTDMFSNSSRTIESIPELMLSLPTEQTGIYHSSTPAHQDLVSLADVMRAAGFATASFCTNPYAGPMQGMDQGFEAFMNPVGAYDPRADRTVPLEEVADWLDQHSDRPRFLYVHTLEPHSPYYPTEGFQGRFATGYRGPLDGSRDDQTGFRNAKTDAEISHIVSLYDEEVAYSDARVGALLDELAARDVLDRTHLFVVSDHGEEFQQHGDWEHGTSLYGTQTRVPLIATGPGIEPGPRAGAAQLLDVMPTVLDLYDLPEPYPLAGRSLRSTLVEAASTEDAPIVGTNYAYILAGIGRVEYSLLEQRRWKLMYRAAKVPTEDGAPLRFALFDVASDPGETQNVIYQHQERVRSMISRLVEWKRAQQRYAADGLAEDYEIDFESQRVLDELGYLDPSADD